MARKILIRGLDAGISEDAIRSRLERFGPVVRIIIERDGRAPLPTALVEMDVSDLAAQYLVFRLNSLWQPHADTRAELLER